MEHAVRGEARQPGRGEHGGVDRSTRMRAHIYDAQVRPIYRFIYQQVGTRAAAESLTTHVFQYAEQYLDVTQSEAAQTAWLFGLARNAVADYWKQYLPLRAGRPPAGSATARRRTPHAVGTPLSSPPNEGLARRPSLAQLERLPEGDRQVLTLRLLAGCSLEDTATALGCTIDEVKIRQYQALETVQRLQA